MQQSLEDFKELVNEELPSPLPTMRINQHNIDLVPGDSLSKISAYRMPPLQQAEMQKQVEELLTETLAQEKKPPNKQQMASMKG